MSLNASTSGTSQSNLSYKILLGLGLLLFIASGCFMRWGIDYTHSQHLLLFGLATFFGLFMAFNIGGNDVANSFGTSVGAKTLTMPQALAIAAIFEVSGAIIAGGEVTQTISRDIVNFSNHSTSPNQFIYVMVSALIAGALWLLYANKKGLPISTTHTVIGGVVGSALIMTIVDGRMDWSVSSINWITIGEIGLSWVLSPAIGALLAYGLYRQINTKILRVNTRIEIRLKELKIAKQSLKKGDDAFLKQLSSSLQQAHVAAMKRDQKAFTTHVARHELETEYYQSLYDIECEKHDIDAFKALRQWVPLITAMSGMVIAAMVVFKGMIHIDMSLLQRWLIVATVGSALWWGLSVYVKHLTNEGHADLTKVTLGLFSGMQVVTAAGFAFSHGANDIANAIGPFAAILTVIHSEMAIQTLVSSAAATVVTVPSPVLLMFSMAMLVGLWFGGKEVIQTIGTRLVEMHPASGFSAELAACMVILGASVLGLPISSTHVLVGAVLGIGLVNHKTNWVLIRSIGMAWVMTLPIAAVLSMLCYLSLTYFIG